MKKPARRDGTKVRPEPTRQRLWAIDVCPTETAPVMTIIIMAATVRGALRACERRYPHRLVDGSRGHAFEADHIAISADGTFEVVKVGTSRGNGPRSGRKRSG